MATDITLIEILKVVAVYLCIVAVAAALAYVAIVAVTLAARLADQTTDFIREVAERKKRRREFRKKHGGKVKKNGKLHQCAKEFNHRSAGG